MDLEALYDQHVSTLNNRMAPFIEESAYDAIIISAGVTKRYFQDDMDAPLRVNPHFAHWCPLYGPHHLMVLEAGKSPRMLYYHPSDYWEEFVPLTGQGWEKSFQIESYDNIDEIWKRAGEFGKVAFIGEKKELESQKASFALNPEDIVKPFHWGRKFKTEYEVACTRKAIEFTAVGHAKAAQLFHQGASEREIFWAYMESVQGTPENVGYEPIIAMNEKGAILHYRQWRQQKVTNKVLLLDAGCRYRHYNSDVTRTFLATDASDTFREIHTRLNDLQLDLCGLAVVDASYLDLNVRAVRKIAQILIDVGVVKLSSVDEAIDKKLVRSFFPHSLGHLLGIQVHDVGADLIDPHGKTPKPESDLYPNLRFSCALEEGYLLTVEPGIYFNPVLLDQIRSNTADLDWKLIDSLMGHGGIRIEDNVLITKDGSENLSRPMIPQPI